MDLSPPSLFMGKEDEALEPPPIQEEEEEQTSEANAAAATTDNDAVNAAVAAAAAAAAVSEWTTTTTTTTTGDQNNVPVVVAERTAKAWKSDEVEAFRVALFKHGPVWNLVANDVRSRSPKACESYYYRCYVKEHPNETHTKAGGGDGSEMKRWTDEEKLAFHVAFKQHGGDWNGIATDIPTRTPKSIERYYYRIYRKYHPDLDTSKGGGATMASKSWTDKEKQTFSEEYAKHGADWSKVSSALPGRTPRSVEQYYYKHYRKSAATAAAAANTTSNNGVGDGSSSSNSNDNSMIKVKHWTKMEMEQFAIAYEDCGGDFDKISDAMQTRSSKQCERYFYRKYRKEHPEVVGDKKYIHWKDKEKEEFRQLFELHGRNWDRIAEQISGDRSAKACELFYYKNKSSNNNNNTASSDGGGGGGGGVVITDDASSNYSFWSAEEKESFNSAHALYGHDWDKVASQINTRTAKSCERYFYRVFRKENSTANATNSGPNNSINKKHTQWKAEEKETFHKAITEHGLDFEKIAASLPGRHESACERFYYRHYRKSTQIAPVKPNKRYHHWSDDDKKKFQRAYVKFGRQWDKIANLFPGRTAKACELYYYKHLKKSTAGPSEDASPTATKKMPRRSLNDSDDKQEEEEEEEEERPAKKARTSAKRDDKALDSSKKSSLRRTAGNNKTPEKVGESNERSSSAKKRTVGAEGRTIGSDSKRRLLRSGCKVKKEDESVEV